MGGWVGLGESLATCSPPLALSLVSSVPPCLCQAPGCCQVAGVGGPGPVPALCLLSPRTLTRAGIRLLPLGMCQQLPRLRVL